GGGTGQGGGEGDAGEGQRGGDRHDVEVADRHDAPFGQDNGGIALRGVELGLDGVPGVTEGVPGGAEDLGDAPEGERVLQVPGVTRLKHGTPGEQYTQAADGRNGAWVRPDLGDHPMENAEIGRERL